MMNISGMRLTAPKPVSGEIQRERLVLAIKENADKIVYIHAGAGYGKTTLLSQLASSNDHTVWVMLDGECDVFSFLNILCSAIKQCFTKYDFSPCEFLPFEGKKDFISIVANAFICSIERIHKSFTIILDDLHTIEDEMTKKLFTCILKYKPESMNVCLSSREAPWEELISIRIRGQIFELSQKDLAFSKDETFQFLGFEDMNIYHTTEGWPLAVSLYKGLLKNGISVCDVPVSCHELLYPYLLYECFNRLPKETTDFLRDTSCMYDLDPQMLDSVLNLNNTKIILDNFVERSLFTSRTDKGYYRYHNLFKEFLTEKADKERMAVILNKTSRYYYDIKQYSKAATYAMRANDQSMLEKVILAAYKEHIKSGCFHEIMIWFNSFKNDYTKSMEWYVAKGAVLSSIGNFIEAKQCLDNAIPSLKDQNKELYIEASVHKARVLRNFMSFEDSNKVLDELLTGISYLKPELLYAVAIEKIYNLCWNSQVNEAKDLIFKMIEICANNGQIKVKAWFERYLSVVSFLLGCMKDSVYYYERSLTIPIEEPQYLDMHSIDLYVAKAYQMLGEREKAIEMVEAELQRLKCKGRYEELWLGYLFAAEIHYQNTFIDRMNGGKKTFECTMQNFKLADEYAPLYRKTELQKKWAKMQRHIYGLMLNDGPVDSIINEIVENLHTVGDYFQTIALARLFSYYGAIFDFKHAAMYARQSIEIGERSGMMMIPTMAYGMLARIAIASSDQNQAVILTRKFLRLCDDNGMIEYFRMRKAYDPVLEFARQNEIEPDFTREMMDFAGFKLKKAYITTLGEFAVYPYYNRNEPIKMRTKKERELFAFLLNAGREGATKEQIYEEIWYDSASNNIKKLIGVNIAQLKKDLSVLGVVNSVESLGKHYSICKDEFVTDVDLFEEAAFELQENNSTDAIDTILALYKGEYLSEFESIWAVSKKIKYEKIYHKALKIYEAKASDLVT